MTLLLMTLLSRLGSRSDMDEVQSVARNLTSVLNTRRGYGGTLTTYGLRDHYLDDGEKSRLTALIEDMADQVRRYEPRLEAAQVHYTGRESTLWAHFTITGRMGQFKQVYQVRFHVIFRNVQVTPGTRSPWVEGAE